MPQTLQFEKYFPASEMVRDIVIGMRPFWSALQTVVIGGLGAAVACAIAKGIA